MSRSPYCDRRSPCLRCSDCCRVLVCGWAMERRPVGASQRGPCEWLRPDPERAGRYLCGFYLDLLAAGQRVQADIMRRQLHFGQGCTNPNNPRRLAVMRMR